MLGVFENQRIKNGWSGVNEVEGSERPWGMRSERWGGGLGR